MSDKKKYPLYTPECQCLQCSAIRATAVVVFFCLALAALLLCFGAPLWL